MAGGGALGAFPWEADLRGRLRARLRQEARDGAHDLSHAERVARTGLALALETAADAEVVVAAALLHDLVHRPKNHPEAPRSAALSAEEARQWCLATPGLAPKADAVAEAVRTHSFTGGEAPTTPAGAVLQDADRLEALGAIGLARCFATGGAMGAGLWDPEDPWALHRALDDKAWSLDHVAKKLAHLPGLMNTEPGRREARARWATVEAFLAALRRELA